MRRNRTLREKLGADNLCKRNPAHNRLAKCQMAQSKSSGEESETPNLQGNPTPGLEPSEEPTEVTAQELLKRTARSASSNSD
jgi:hypothetical protein